MDPKLNQDAEFPEAKKELLKALDSVTSTTSGGDPVHFFAEAFAKYLRTPD